MGPWGSEWPPGPLLSTSGWEGLRTVDICPFEVATWEPFGASWASYLAIWSSGGSKWPLEAPLWPPYYEEYGAPEALPWPLAPRGLSLIHI